MRARGLLLLTALSLPAAAWPVDAVLEVEPGKERFVRAAGAEWLEVEDAKVATAELLPSGELLLTGQQPGRTLALAYVEGGVKAFRIEVRAAKARAASPGPLPCGATLEKDGTLTAEVKDDACRTALLKYLEASDQLTASQLSLTFQLPALQAQHGQVEKAVRRAAPAAKVRYLGAGVVLEGSLTPAEHRAVLWELFRNSVGRVSLEDRTTPRSP